MQVSQRLSRLKGSPLHSFPPPLLQVLEELGPLYELPPREQAWVRRMLDYNVKGGKMNRGLMVVASIKELAKVRGASDERAGGKRRKAGGGKPL